MRSMGSMGSGPGFQSNSSSVSQPNRSSCCGSSFVSVQTPEGEQIMGREPDGRLRQLTADEERDLGLGNSSQYCPPASSRGSQASLNSSWVLPPGPIQNQGQIHLHPSRRVNQQQQDIHNLALNTTLKRNSGKPPAAEHAAGDPLWNTLGDWIQRTTSGRQVNMGQWIPYYRDKNGVERPVTAGAPNLKVTNRVQITGVGLNVNKKKIYPQLTGYGKTQEQRKGGENLEESQLLTQVESGAASSSADSGNSKFGTARDSGATDPGASGAADSGAAGDASGARRYKKKSRCSAFTARLTSGVKATFKMARNTVATTLVITVIMTVFIVLIHHLGWIATHERPPIME